MPLLLMGKTDTFRHEKRLGHNMKKSLSKGAHFLFKNQTHKCLWFEERSALETLAVGRGISFFSFTFTVETLPFLRLWPKYGLKPLSCSPSHTRGTGPLQRPH